VEPNWSFGQAVFFSGTVLTTIGYGHVSPLSSGGKVFCILYAIFGIPITLVLISACVERLLLVTNKLYDKMKTMSVFYRNQTTIDMKALTYTHFGLVLAFVLVFFFLIPAAVFSSIEKEWNYLDALYYCFISLSTIGLGDYIPGDKYEQPYRVFYKIATTCKLRHNKFDLFFSLNFIPC
jgi:potassium channel subfamily K protein 1